MVMGLFSWSDASAFDRRARGMAPAREADPDLRENVPSRCS
jgi:hypothetical protein